MQTWKPSDNTPDDPERSNARSGIAVFEVLVSEHADMLEAYLRSLLGQGNDLDDIVQETMLFNTADFDGGFGHTTGSFLLTLEAGQDYAMNMLLGSYANSYMHVSMTVVPTPSAFALLGMGGLGLTRRRR